MQIEDYLTKSQTSLNKCMRRIKDFDVFDFNYVPAKPIMREEVKPIIDALVRYQKTGIANNVLILGARGSGKSVLTRYLMEVMSNSLDFVYANCRQYNTSYKILAHLLGIKPRGRGLDEIWTRFERERPGKVVFILDEIDLLSERDKHKDLLYLVTRSPNRYMSVLLSNNPKILGVLDESIKSTLQPEIIHFNSYPTMEVEAILVDRAQVGLHSTPRPVINQIAAMCVKNTNSDVRVAIKTLYLWALDPKIGLREHFAKAKRDIVSDVVKDLNDKNLLILKAIESCSGRFVKEAYETYRRISTQHQEDLLSYQWFYTNLAYMQSLGLIVLVSTKVDRTYAYKVQMTFAPQVLEWVWRSRFN